MKFERTNGNTRRNGLHDPKQLQHTWDFGDEFRQHSAIILIRLSPIVTLAVRNSSGRSHKAVRRVPRRPQPLAG
jgi:hypothetical protein